MALPRLRVSGGVLSPLATLHRRAALRGLPSHGAAHHLPPLAHPLCVAALVSEDDILAATSREQLHSHLLQQLGVADAPASSYFSPPALPSPRGNSAVDTSVAGLPSQFSGVARALFHGASQGVDACEAPSTSAARDASGVFPAVESSTLLPAGGGSPSFARSDATSRTYIPAPPPPALSAPPSPSVNAGSLLHSPALQLHRAGDFALPLASPSFAAGARLSPRSGGDVTPAALASFVGHTDESLELPIPTLPAGRTLTLTVLSNWGDEAWVGLMGLELFAAPDGQRVSGTVALATPLPSGPLAHDPRADPSRLLLPRDAAPSCDDLRSWLHPWDARALHAPALAVTFARPTALALVRVWNYNAGGRTHSFRGVRRIRLALDEAVIFEGEVRRAPGRLAAVDGADGDAPAVLACAETLRFSSDAALLDAVAAHDPHAALAAAYMAQHRSNLGEADRGGAGDALDDSLEQAPGMLAGTGDAASPLNSDVGDLDELLSEFGEAPRAPAGGLAAAPAPAAPALTAPAAPLRAPVVLTEVATDSLDADDLDAMLCEASPAPAPAAVAPEPHRTPLVAAHAPGREGATVRLATLPLASTLTLAVLSNHGDPHYVGLARVEVLVAVPHGPSGEGRVVALELPPESIWACPRDINDAHGVGGSGSDAEAFGNTGGGDPRSLDCLVVPRAWAAHEWLAPLPEGSSGAPLALLALHLGAPVHVAGLRVWNVGTLGGGEDTLRGARHVALAVGDARVCAPLPPHAADLWQGHRSAARPSPARYDVLTLRRASAWPLAGEGATLPVGLAQHLDFVADSKGGVRLLPCGGVGPAAVLPPPATPASMAEAAHAARALLRQAYEPPLASLTPSRAPGAAAAASAPVGLVLRCVLYGAPGDAELTVDSLAVFDAAGQRVPVRPWQLVASSGAPAALAHDPTAPTGSAAPPWRAALRADGSATIAVLLDAPVGVSLVRVVGATAVFVWLDDFPVGYASAARNGVATLALGAAGVGAGWVASDLAPVEDADKHVQLFNDAVRVSKRG